MVHDTNIKQIKPSNVSTCQDSCAAHPLADAEASPELAFNTRCVYMHDGMKLSDGVERLVGELLCRTDLTHISALESGGVMCREASGLSVYFWLP